jgi:thiamine pyrophosphokinase
MRKGRERRIKVIVVLGGDITEPKFYRQLITEHDFLIAADGGSENVRKLGLVPNAAIGDFDSTSRDTMDWLLRHQVDLRSYPTNKNQTDGELALAAAIDAGADLITLTASWGGRLDHTISNLFLLRLAVKHGVPCKISEANGEIFILENEVEIEGSPGDMVSFIPLEACRGLKLSGFEYPASHIDIGTGSTRGLSNLLIKGLGKIKIDLGQALIIRSRPQEGNESKR